MESEVRSRGQRLLFVALAVAGMVALFAACSRAKGEEDALRVAIPAGPVTLDPRLAADAVGDKISHLICDGLFKRNQRLELVPNLAARYERLSDTSYRFFLRDGVRFHDGSKLTAQDVAYTYRSIMEGKVASAFSSTFERIKKITVEAPLVLRIDLKEPYAPFLTMLTGGIVPRGAAERMGSAFATAPVGAGPYRFVRYVPGSVVELAANTQYAGEVPKIRRLIFEVIKDDNIRVLKLMKGDIDLVQNAVPPLLMDHLVAQPNLAKKEGTGIVMAYMGFNLEDPVLKRRQVRQAIAYAIDRDEIIAHRWKGMAVKANSILAPSNWAYDPKLRQYPYDPKKAMRLLDEAGLSDPDGNGPAMRLEIALKTSTVKSRIDIARMIAHQLAKVGIGVKVEPYEWGTFYKDVRSGNFQVYTLSWVGVTEPDIFYDVCNSSQFPPNGLNRGRYRNPQIDKLVEAGRVTMDRGKRRMIYSKVQRILLVDLPYIPLWYEKNVVVYNKGLKGVSLRPNASYRTFVDVEKR